MHCHQQRPNRESQICYLEGTSLHWPREGVQRLQSACTLRLQRTSAELPGDDVSANPAPLQHRHPTGQQDLPEPTQHGHEIHIL